MHGVGTFFDPRLNDPIKYPVAARAGFGNIHYGIRIAIASRQSLALFNSISLQSPHHSQLRELILIQMLPHAVMLSFVIGHNAIFVTLNRSGQSLAGTCIHPTRWESMPFKRIEHLIMPTKR